MSKGAEVAKEIWKLLELEPRIDLARHPLSIDVTTDGEVALKGEVENISEKKLIINKARSVFGVKEISDQIFVRLDEMVEDGAVAEYLTEKLSDEPLLKNCSLTLGLNGQFRIVRKSLYRIQGNILFSVSDGVISLDRFVNNFIQKQIAGVLAWWTPGTRHVRNLLNVVPPEVNYSDDQLSDTVRMVLEKNPLLTLREFQVLSQNGAITLSGSVHTEAQKLLAENDAWYVEGVNMVKNHLSIQE